MEGHRVGMREAGEWVYTVIKVSKFSSKKVSS